MKKTILSGLIGLVLGAFLMGYIMYAMAPGMMMMEDESKFEFAETATKLEQSIKDNGWSTPAVHDLKKTMTKFGYDVKEARVYEICHPSHASKILLADDDRIVASLMPCRIAIYEKNDGKTYISRMNSGLMAQMMSDLVIEVMGDASRESEEIMKVILKVEE